MSSNSGTSDASASFDVSSLLEHRANTINLAAGPSRLPDQVLLEAAQGLLEYNGTGIGLTELSHRSSHFQNCLKAAESDLRELLEIPQDFHVLFLQGGGLTQFSMAPLNLISAWMFKQQQQSNSGSSRPDDLPTCDYIVTGSWSLKAAGEAKRLGCCNVNVAIDGRDPATKAFGQQLLPPSEQWNWSEKPAFIYYCANETVNGIEIEPPQVPEHLKDVPLVADMSSNILSKPIPWKEANFGLVYAGAQKNIGPSGLTIVMVRKDLVVDPDDAVKNSPGSLAPRIPAMLSYKVHADNGSLYNTPPMFPIYVAGLVFRHLLKNGGVAAIDAVNAKKAQAVYDCIDASSGFYSARVVDGLRSRMNVCFGLQGGADLEDKFVKAAEKQGIKQIKGHRSVGGIRTSLYNAVTLDQVEKLVAFMKSFMQASE